MPSRDQIHPGTCHASAKSFTLEPISPELALVDPALARADLARLAVVARPEEPADLRRALDAVDHAPPEIAARSESEPSIGPRSMRHRVLPILAGISLAVNGFLVAIVVAGGRNNEAAPRPPVVLAAATAETVSRPPVTARAAAEQRILALVVQSPSGKLPPALVDRRTGLAKNNLQAVCRIEPSRSFLCLVRPAQHRRGEGLYVRYRPSRDGRGSFAWYPYRSG
jgi:hypothetical protein